MGIRDSSLKGPERIYRFLLLLYPPGFRLRFGPEMLQIFKDSHPHEARHASFAARLAYWHWTFNDLLCSLPGEWRLELIRPNKIKLPLRRWADSLVIPFTVFGY